jgi:hypothetical protein
MECRRINKQDYNKLLELDKKVYPTDNPVTPKILDSWFQNNPEFGMIFEEAGKMKGICIAIPLNENWIDLISGNLTEADLDKSTIFDNQRDSLLGIHIYHIEKFENCDSSLYKESLIELNKIIKNLKKENSGLEIIGFSGLCVTKQGINLFYNKLNCRERDFISSEHILTRNNKLEIFNSSSQNELEKKLSENYEYINRCKMLITYPNEQSIVWNYLK